MTSTTHSPAFNDVPPQYEDSTSGPHQYSQQPVTLQDPFNDSNAPQDLNSQGDEAPQNTTYDENMYGEMKPSSERTGSGFGEDTKDKSSAYRSDEIYSENRFGELGRADTFDEDSEPRKRDKLLGTAEQVIGKVTHNQCLHDKGVARKSPPRT